MRIERLPRDEQTHDFARSLENQVDPAVSQKPLDGYRLLAARSERLRRFIAAPAADLHGVVDDLPGPLAGPKLAQRGFESDIGGFVAVYDSPRVNDRLLHPHKFLGGTPQLFRNGSM